MLRLEVSRRATINESTQLNRLLAEAEREKGPVEIDCTHTEAYGPFGVTLLASVFAARRREHRSTEFVLPAEGKVRDAFDETGLLPCVNGEPAPSLDAVHAVNSTNLEELISATSTLWGGVGPSAEAKREPLELTLRELLSNMMLWSESKVGAWLMVRWAKKCHALRLVLLDRGLGIPAALRRAQVENLHRSADSEVIEAAISEPHVTSRPHGQEGRGLERVRDAICGRGGRVTVISLGAKISCQPDRLVKATCPPLHGTAVEIDLGT